MSVLEKLSGDELTVFAKEAEMFETPEWAVERILDVELMPHCILDPCCGRGVMAKVGRRYGYGVASSDLHYWGYGDAGVDFLLPSAVDHCFPSLEVGQSGLLMNPPFSKSVQFVERGLELGFRKIVMFQRLAFIESYERRAFLDANSPNRIYTMGSRASCWRVDIPDENRKSGTTTAHAWFVWERGHPVGTVMGRLYEKGVR